MKKPIILLFLLLASLPTYAQTPDPAAQEQNRQIQFQQQLERGAAEQKELQRVQKDVKEFEEERDEDLEQESGKVVQDLRSIQCFRINQIDISPNKVIPKLVEYSFTKEYLGKCLTINQMIKLRKKLANYLADNGVERLIIIDLIILILIVICCMMIAFIIIIYSLPFCLGCFGWIPLGILIPIFLAILAPIILFKIMILFILK